MIFWSNWSRWLEWGRSRAALLLVAGWNVVGVSSALYGQRWIHNWEVWLWAQTFHVCFRWQKGTTGLGLLCLTCSYKVFFSHSLWRLLSFKTGCKIYALLVRFGKLFSFLWFHKDCFQIFFQLHMVGQHFFHCHSSQDAKETNLWHQRGWSV